MRLSVPSSSTYHSSTGWNARTQAGCGEAGGAPVTGRMGWTW